MFIKPKLSFLYLYIHLAEDFIFGLRIVAVNCIFIGSFHENEIYFYFPISTLSYSFETTSIK